jgi:hypothetical protein
MIPIERIEGAIFEIRGERVMLDADLAAVYGVETKELVRAVKRNAARFPAGFVFQLTRAEYARLRCQIGTSKGRGGRRYPPYAFTEQSVEMLNDHFAESARLEKKIRKNLKGLGYGG